MSGDSTCGTRKMNIYDYLEHNGNVLRKGKDDKHINYEVVLCQLAAPGLERNWCYVSWLHQDWSSSPTPILMQSTEMTRTQHTKCRLCSAF
jgi:hypothetical protein